MIDEVHIGIISSTFNIELCKRLEEGVHSFFAEQNVLVSTRELRVPGAYEIPLGAQWLITDSQSKDMPLNALVALGVIIRGETSHFDYVAGPTAQGIMQVGLRTGIPIGFGVVTADTYRQAEMRSSLTVLAAGETKKDKTIKESNKGYEAAAAVWAMIAQRRSLDGF